MRPTLWKPLVGAGGQGGGFESRAQERVEAAGLHSVRDGGVDVASLRAKDAHAVRVIYTATFADAVYVLHAFQKKTQATAKRDLDLAATRLRDLRRG
ncbi:MAG: type II toxin-antitoxin system RelE/ParE family toxin [Acetobacteraceae bacterium]|nr:type II toxin-antitoxin system RelE/ParE family toxin [Acetobacteraceae bacterium]